MTKQLVLGLGYTERLRRIPRLNIRGRLAMAAIKLCDERPLSEQVGYHIHTRVLRKLLREKLIEVVSWSPAVYRVTRLGQLAWSMRNEGKLFQRQEPEHQTRYQRSQKNEQQGTSDHVPE